jgi:DNA-binding beta-propeller fold protein YncE
MRRPLHLQALSFLPLLAPLLALAHVGAGCSDDPPPPAPRNVGTVEDLMADLPASCAFACSDCAEPATPYACTTLKPWAELPHAASCGNWDGKNPEPQQGKCTASEPTGEAARKAGPIPDGVVLPDGHRIRPAGREVVFAEPDLLGTFPMSIYPMIGSRFALVSDGGIKDNVLRAISLDALAAGGDPVASYIPFPRPTSLYYGVVYLAPDRVLASGGGDAMIYAFDIDPQTGALARASGRDIALGTAGDDPWYSGAIAATPAGDRLIVAPSEHAEEFLVLSLAAADYGAKLASIPIDGSQSIFDLRLDPFDPEGDTFYASDMGGSRLMEIDAATSTITRTIPLMKNPAQMAFLDPTYVVVAEADSDALAVVNRAAGEVEARVPVFEPDSPRGFSPTALAYDTAQQRLYATLAGVNAVEVYDVTMGSPPTVTPAGRIPTSWWPSGVMIDQDGSLVVINGKGRGTGPELTKFGWSGGAITDRMAGSIQHVPAANLGALGPLTAITDENRRLGDAPGRSEVTCPGGAAYDFPVPADNQSGPSKHIKHVILVVRENKTYDAIFGDRPDLGDGDPALIMGEDPEIQARVWQNARAVAEAFTNFDNFYTDAEQSLQGHTWTVYGRTNDFMERSWLSTWGRGTRPPTMTITEMAKPEENGVFVWLSKNGIDYDNMGEIVGDGPNGLDPDYPGLVYAQNRPDTDKSCYLGGRMRVLCDLKPFTYMLQPNDHTNGGQAGSAAPEVMIAVNDEATGLLLDALSHSPYWKDTLLIVTEDDPQDGADHVDAHRTILLMASPWVKRGYVSHGHYDMASVYKLVAHIFGVPYNNEMMRNALLPIDAFTSTPDYTPFTYLPRTVEAACNPAGTREAREAESWDWDEPDDQPGLSQQVMQLLKRSRERGVKVTAPKR